MPTKDSSLTGLPSELLPFHVRVAREPRDFEGLCRVRSEAYARHPYKEPVSEMLASLDERDRRAFLLVALDKQTQEVLGTMRLSSSLRGETPINRHVWAQLQELGLCDVAYIYGDRFAVALGPQAERVSLALFKAMWQVAALEGVEWVFGSVLRPLARRYRRGGMRILLERAAGFAMPHLHADDYYAIGGRCQDLEANILALTPRHHPFYFGTRHPDLAVALPARAALQPT